MVLSGMGSMDMMTDNVSTMQEFRPLDENELAAVAQVCDIFIEVGGVACTACRYCTEVCPKGIPIPELFNCLNAKVRFNDQGIRYVYDGLRESQPAATVCIECGACENACPQHLEIRSLLKEVTAAFEG